MEAPLAQAAPPPQNMEEALPTDVAVAAQNYELLANGEVYVDTRKFHEEFKAYLNGRYGDGVKSFIENAGLKVEYALKKPGINGQHTLVKKGNGKGWAPNTEYRVVKKNDAMCRIITEARDNTRDIAYLAFFETESGERLPVKITGPRTMHRICFKADQVGKVLGIDFAAVTGHPESAYRLGIDYEMLHSELSEGASASDIPGEIHLTFEGLMYTLRTTNSPDGPKFKWWVYNDVLSHTSSDLYRTDYNFVAAFLRLVPSNVSCLYLVNTGKQQKDKVVYKYGKTTNLKKRFYEHTQDFGTKATLDAFVLIPEDDVSRAETLFKQSITKECQLSMGKRQEILQLSSDQFGCVRNIMQTIGDKYNGSLSRNLHAATSKLSVRSTEYKMRIKDLQKEVAVLKERLTSASLNAKVAEQERRIHELETQVRQLKCDAEDKNHD